jgi:hypothetical protein
LQSSHSRWHHIAQGDRKLLFTKCLFNAAQERATHFSTTDESEFKHTIAMLALGRGSRKKSFLL